MDGMTENVTSRESDGTQETEKTTVDMSDVVDIDSLETAEKEIPDSIGDLGSIELSEDIEELGENDVSEENTDLYKMVYDDTLYFVDGIVAEYEFYPTILQVLKDGNISVELKKRYMLKAIDEVWVKTIEESLTVLDNVMRKPSKFIEETEEVLPIELSKNITSRSIQHLSQHTNYIADIKDDVVTPSKILNVFRDETMLTYENKFINTLINRLYTFIAIRYDKAVKEGKDEKCTSLKFSGDFVHGKKKCKLNMSFEISEEPEEKVDLKNYYFTTELWKRVKKLYSIVRTYTNSDFVKAMGKNYIRPPVIRTNAILKNKDLRQCLALWQFIESYENIGYDMLIQENAEDVDEKYIRELYSTCALQYLIFRYNIKNEFEEENKLASDLSSTLSPKIVDEIKPFSADDYNVFDSKYQRVVPISEIIGKRRKSDSEKDIEIAIDVALEADLIYDQKRVGEELKKAEDARRLAEEEARRLAEEEARRLAEEEARRLAEEAKKKKSYSRKRDHIPRKRKKQIRRTAEIKAESEGYELPDIFDYDVYMTYITEETKKQ